MKHINPVLLAITVIAICLSIYAFARDTSYPAKAAVPELSIELKEHKQTTTSKTEPLPPQVQGPTPPPPEPSKATPPGEAQAEARKGFDGRIEGVVRRNSGEPLGGVTVVAVDEALKDTVNVRWTTPDDQFEAMLADYLEAARGGISRVTADESGRFAFENLDPRAAYTVSCHTSEFGTTERTYVECGSFCDLKFHTIGLLRVRVVDETGCPVRRIRYIDQRDGSGGLGSSISSDGDYELPWYTYTRHFVIHAPGFRYSEPITEEALQAPGYVVSLTRAPQLAGTLTDPKGRPVPRAYVLIARATDLQGNELDVEESETYAYTDGKFRFESLEPGIYWLDVSPLSHSLWAQRGIRVELADDVHLDLTMDIGRQLVLDVRDVGGTSLSDIDLKLHDASGREYSAYLPNSYMKGPHTYYGLTDDKLTGTVHKPGYAPAEFEIAPGSDDVSHSVTLFRGATLKGRIVDPAGNVVKGLRLRVMPSDAKYEEKRNHWIGARDGKFEVDSLAPGVWEVEVYHAATLVDPDTKRSLQLVAGVNELDLTVQVTRTLHVDIRLEAGLDAWYATVYLKHDDHEEWDDYTLDLEYQRDGLDLPLLPAGRYRIYATSNDWCSTEQVFELREGKSEVTLSLGSPNCLRVSTVMPKSNAEAAGVKVGDVIVAYANQAVTSIPTLVRLTRECEEHQQVPLKVVRDGKEIELTLKGGVMGLNANPARR